MVSGLGVCVVNSIYHNYCLIESSPQNVNVGLNSFCPSASEVSALYISQKILNVLNGCPLYLLLLNYCYYSYQWLKRCGSLCIYNQLFKLNKCFISALCLSGKRLSIHY